MQAITSSDMQKLLIQEQNFKDGVLATAHALKTIQEHRLYKAKGYDNFEGYCIDELQIKKTQAYRLIAAANMRLKLQKLSPNWGHPDLSDELTHEGQLRVLVDVDDNLLEAVVEEAGAIAEEKNSRLTAAVLKRAKTKVVGKPAAVRCALVKTSHSEANDIECDSLEKVHIRARKNVHDHLDSIRVALVTLEINDSLDHHLDAIWKAVAAR